MRYTHIQKFISSFVLFSLLFGITFRVPFVDYGAYAGSSDFFNLVSIIVDEESYDDIDEELERYAEDIQGVLENTKVVILPSPVDVTSFEIASLNESLYFEGYKALDDDVDFESRLVGTVLVGDFNLPVVYNGNESSKTIIPFTDFDDKGYIYNHENNKYEVNDENLDGLQSEIWHGVISANTGNYDDNIDSLINYFDKNHEFYSGTGNFKYSEGLLNGNDTVGVPSTYEPYVFYYDQYRENASLNYEKFNSYEIYLDNLEDIIYNRYTNELATKISEEAIEYSSGKIDSLLNSIKDNTEELGSDSVFSAVDDSFYESLNASTPDTTTTPDIQSRHVIDEVAKTFQEIFSEGTLGEFRKDIYNAGRYNGDGNTVNMDTIPEFITMLDVVYSEMIKDVNNELEDQIDSIVDSGIATDIVIGTKIVVKDGCGEIYENYFYGTKGENITTAEECSIYRGSTSNGGKLVEANRGYNINISPDDIDVLSAEPSEDLCFEGLVNGESYEGWWGRNTPLNSQVNSETLQSELDSNDLKGAIVPLYDIGGSSQIFDSTKESSPTDCYENNYILSEKSSDTFLNGVESCETVYRVPTYGNAIGWTCETDNNGGTDNKGKTYEDIMSSGADCEEYNVYLDGVVVKSSVDTCSDGGVPVEVDYYYKTIPSEVFHKSPTKDELETQITSMMASDLGIDANRYVEFISVSGDSVKIEYPSLFRVTKGEDEAQVTIDTVAEELDEMLEQKSTEINSLLPGGGIDLIAYLKGKESETLEGIFEEGGMTEYDTLVFAIFWNSLDTVSAKYSFVMDYYMNDQSNNESAYKLVGNKKEYEIAYMGADGDASNMYIKVDPEGKSDNPYAETLSENINLSSSLYASNIGSNPNSSNSDELNSVAGGAAAGGAAAGGAAAGGAVSGGGTFNCAPPEGVPIWEWMPAVMCRLGDMLPPTITFSDGACGATTLFGMGTSSTNSSSAEFAEFETFSDSGGESLSSSGNPSYLGTSPTIDYDALTCNIDLDNNGLNDCVEQELTNGGFIELTSDSEKYYINTTALLKAKIKDEDGNTITTADNSYVNFYIEKIEKVNDEVTNIVFDINNPNIDDKSIISDYVVFTEYEIRSSNGVSNYQVSSKNEEVNIYLRANIVSEDNSGEEVISVESNLLKVEVRGSRLFNTSYKIESHEDGSDFYYSSESMRVDDSTNIVFADGTDNAIEDISGAISNMSDSDEKIVLFVKNLSTSGEEIGISYPLKVDLYNGDIMVAPSVTITEGDLNIFKGMFTIKKSGSYTIEITDNEGFITTKSIEVLPEIPSRLDIQLGTSIMQTGGNVSTSFVTIYDKFDNITTGEYYDVDLEIKGNGLEFLNNGSDTYSTNTYEGYKVFRLQSTDREDENRIVITVSDINGDKLIGSNVELETIDNINLTVQSISPSNEIEVGGDTYEFELSIRDSGGKILTDFNSRAYLIANPVFLSPVDSYVEIIDGKAIIEYTTTNVAGKDISIEFQVEGLDEIATDEITIYPSDPIKISLVLSDDKMEASSTVYSTLNVELKDRYNNIVFDDNNTETTLEILDDYSNIITSEAIEKTVIEGVTSYRLFGTINPGVANFKISTNPSLYTNSFTIEDSGKETTINGVGENVGKIETFYFWNSEKLDGKNYSSLYTTLLGSNYGDITKKDYLAGSLLFERNNKSLAVTSLLNYPFKYSNILSIGSNGNIEKVDTDGDLTQSIDVNVGFTDEKLTLDLYNESLNIYIGKLLYNLDETNELMVCEGIMADCFDEDDTSFALKSTSSNYSVYNYDDRLILRNTSGKNVLEIDDEGNIYRYGTLDFEFDENNDLGYLKINISTGGSEIAELGLNMVDSIMNISRDEDIFESKVNSITNSILIFFKTNTYGSYDSGSGGNQSKIIYYNDPFDSDNVLNSFSSDNIYGYENFTNKNGLGWSESNKALLAFAAGSSVGESVQDNMSFSVINLGDPVLSLKKIEKKLSGTTTSRKFDSTIGKLLNDDIKVEAYHVFDYDNDGLDDILLVKNDGYFELLENKNVEGRIINKGDLANIVDLGSVDLVGTGDFTNDGYGDIFFVNDDGEPYLLNNTNKNFARYSLVSDFDLDGRIMQSKVFDMDNDGYSDVVTLDDSGEINIHYGAGSSTRPSFTKLTISGVSGIELSTESRNDNSLVYYDSLYQPSEVGNDNQRIDNIIYKQIPYSPDTSNITYEAANSGEIEIPDSIGNAYFLKTEYSESAGIKVEKTFEDVNGGYVKTSDTIKAEITLTNVSGRRLSGIAFLEKVPETFLIDESTIVAPDGINISNGLTSYNFLLDNFSMNSGDVITITYEGKVRPIAYSYIDVGYFEAGEVGNDAYGDIIVKENNQNCGDDVGIYRSLSEISSRSYGAGSKTPTCNEDNIVLPDNIQDNIIDTNGDGIPDYIEELTDTTDLTQSQAYAEEQLSIVNSDAGELGTVSSEIESAVEDVSNFIQGLSCGFGSSSCISLPLNRAPLAPGNDLVFQGTLIGDGLNIDEGLPIFSSITGIQYGPLCIQSVRPVSPLARTSPYTCGDTSAGGRLGIWSPMNQFRIFVTPTLTGGVGVAMCFGGPARAEGNIPPQGISPLEPGGNCIVLAEKFDWCGTDDTKGAPASAGFPIGGGCGGGGSEGCAASSSDPSSIGDNASSFGIINGNCDYNDTSNTSMTVSSDILDDYLGTSAGSAGSESPTAITVNAEMFTDSMNKSLYVGADGSDISVGLDLAALQDGDYEDIIQIEQERIFAFPDWFMGWVTRQIEEIANKLTDWPTIFIILPDLTGIFDSNWGEIIGNNEAVSAPAINLDESLAGSESIAGLVNSANSGIQEAYEFIGSIPLVYVDQQTVNITLPWISQTELDKAITTWELTASQRDTEIARVKGKWSGGFTCDENTPEKQQLCEEKYAIGNNVALNVLADMDGLTNGIRSNIEIMKEYKTLPEKINKLISIKQTYLEQILCNIDSLTYILGGRIGENGERFKAWVEVYILVKAILKGWQAIVDVFYDYEEECHDCKNERQDALEREFWLISLIVPDIPVIRFPKWPDIVLDLHNIRAGLRIPLPEFDINTKPIIIPSLPDLFLPDIPYINADGIINIPDIPVLPLIEIPELPELPSLPSVELPNLPPPPNLPDILAEIEAVVEIAELIVEAMCILKSSPFHPEWRAGDQIAFLTERGGYLPTDFIEVSSPEFSYPFVDAIVVASYVNLEFETDFIVELAKQIAMPLNSFSNDFVNLFDISKQNLDYSGATPGHINIEGEVGLDLRYQFSEILAKRFALGITQLSSVLDERKNKTLTTKEFMTKISDGLASDIIVSNPKYDKLRNIWEEVNNYSYVKEDNIIEELQENNRQKFEALSDIINTEIIETKKLREQFKDYGKSEFVTEVGYNSIDNGLYNETLDVYNQKFKDSAMKLMNSDGDSVKKDLNKRKDTLLNSINTPIEKYSEGVSENVEEKLYLAATFGIGDADDSDSTQTACQAQAETDYQIEYDGIYIVEGDHSYKLSDYTDEFDGDEVTTIIDLDNDGDDDLLYSVKGQLFFKENLDNNPSKIYVTSNPIVVDINDNKFFNSDTFYEAINNAYEVGNANGTINLLFSRPTDNSISNFRLGFYTIIDKYLNEENSDYRPEFIKTDIIDAVADIDNVTEISTNDLFTKRKNLVYIKNTGNLNGAKLIRDELINIRGDLIENIVVNIRAETSLYAGSSGFTITYYEELDEIKETKTLDVSAYQNVEFLKNIVIIGISGNAYVKGSNSKVYNGTEINTQKGLPLFPGDKILYTGDETSLSGISYVELYYYDDSELNLDFDLVKNWEIFDLGPESDNYYVTSYRFNDYYYAKINSFKENIDGTLSKQILLSPQLESDKSPPSLSISNISIPVYQQQTVDLTDYIYEFGGINNVEKIIIDMDLETDTSGDGDTKNDNDAVLEGDYNDKVSANLSNISLKIEFGEFEELFEKEIGITLIDANGNEGYREITFEVYSPTPTISSYNDGVIYGDIDEELTDEPINVYRYRGGSLTKLELEGGGIKTLTEDGKYVFNSDDSNGGLTLFRGSEEIVFIDEITGKISFTDPNLSVEVLSSNNSENDTIYPKIIINDSLEEIFYEYIKIEGVDKVEIVDDYEGIEDKGIYFKLTDSTNYNYYSIAETLDYNPGALLINRQNSSNDESLFTIFKDGRINTLNTYYKLSYSSYDDYIVIKLIDSHFNREVGRLMFKIYAEYIME